MNKIETPIIIISITCGNVIIKQSIGEVQITNSQQNRGQLQELIFKFISNMNYKAIIITQFDSI